MCNSVWLQSRIDHGIGWLWSCDRVFTEQKDVGDGNNAFWWYFEQCRKTEIIYSMACNLG